MGMEFSVGNNINSLTWAFGPPLTYEWFGGAGLCARRAVRTGWKARATGRTFTVKNQIPLNPPLPKGNFRTPL